MFFKKTFTSVTFVEAFDSIYFLRAGNSLFSLSSSSPKFFLFGVSTVTFHHISDFSQFSALAIA